MGGKQISAFQIILLAVFGAIGVGAVLIFALATAGNSNGTVGAVVIWGTLDQNTMTTVLRGAADADPRFLQVSYVHKDPATFESELSDALASGKGPDLFLLRDDEAIRDATKIYTIPYTSLSQSQFQNTFVSAADSYLASNGVLGIPVLVDPLVLYWDRDMLSSNGISEPPQFWNQLNSYTAQITQKDTTGVIHKSAIALGTYKNIDAAKDILAMLILQAGGTITSLNSSGHLAPSLTQGGGASAAAQSALLFYTQFADPSNASYSWSGAMPDARQAFAAGNLALYIGYASEEALIHATNPNLNFAAAAMPQLPGATTKIDEGHVYALAIPRAAHNAQGALTIAYLIGNSSQLSANLASAFGMSSARRDVLAIGAQGDSDLFNKMTLTVRTWLDPDPAQTGSIFQAMIEDTESGALKPSDAIGRADQQIGNILSQ